MDSRVSDGTSTVLVFALIAVALAACDSGARSTDAAATEGPGEFEGRLDGPYNIAVDPNGDVWVGTSGKRLIFALAPTGAAYVRPMPTPRGRSDSGRPVFSADGRIGLTILGVEGHFGARVWVDSVGSILREDTLPARAEGDLGYGRITWQRSDGSESYTGILAPFGPRDRLAHARSGGYARAVTSRYEVDLYGADGVLLQTIRRDDSGPMVSSAERQREEFVIDSLAAFYEQQPFRVEYEPGEIPGQKPPIDNLWFDEDGRLWVKLWDTDGDSLARAHVYGAAGEFLFHAAWPRDVSLEDGAIRGDVAIGFATDEFDVPEIVKMVFGPGAS
ncbi:MAG: hypothetical protein OXF01_13155 [Gemmatimonadetes bacterium]|nr:hypothetical protein [Gemmatimonadota bacterium]